MAPICEETWDKAFISVMLDAQCVLAILKLANYYLVVMML